MTRKPETIGFWIGRLPHWEVVDGRYFITIHTAGAIPEEGKRRIEQMRLVVDKQNHSSHLQQMRKLFKVMEYWLHRVKKNAWFENPVIAELIVNSLRYYESLGYWRLFEFVVMPNHAHLFLEMKNGTLKERLLAWKKWTGREAKKILSSDVDRFWQREWFDHWSRSDSEDDRIVRYIRTNPVKAGLVTKIEDWRFGSW